MTRRSRTEGAITCVDRTVDAAVPPVPIRVYDALRGASGSGQADHAMVLWMHGGGFIGGTLGMPESDAVCRALASRGYTCVSVDYRLAPYLVRRRRRAHYPAALEDCLGAWQWLEDFAEQQAVPAGRRFVAGASAGGALAATLALRLRDKGLPAPAGVALVYPLLHPTLLEPSPELRQALASAPRIGTFTPRSVSWMARTYVGKRDLGRIPEAFPGGAELTDFPPTLIVNSERDSLRASGERFAEELQTFGRPVELTFEPDTLHGHLNRPRKPGFDSTIDRMAIWMAKTAR